MHEHDHCEHASLKFCSRCDVVYCTACTREWRQTQWWTYTIAPSPNTTINYPTCTSDTAFVTSCNHT